MSSSQANPAQAIAFAMRDFVNERQPTESQVAPFLARIGGLPTVFGLIVAISDSTHLRLVRRVLERLFDDSPEGHARILAPEVTQYLLAGVSHTQPKHVRLVSLQQAHAYIRFAAGRSRLLEQDLFLALLQLLRDEDVEITEEVMRLLRKLGATHDGLTRLLAPDTLAVLFGLTIEQTTGDQSPATETSNLVHAQLTDERVMEPFIDLLRQSSRAPIDSIVLLRVLTLLTQIACGTRLPTENEGPRMEADATHSAEEIRLAAWTLYQQYGLFRLLLDLCSLTANRPNHDMLVQLNALELLMEVVSNSPRLDDAFAVQLTKEILDGAADHIRVAASAAEKNSTASLLPTSSFVTVAVMQVFNRMATVSHAKSLHSWYRESAFLLFLSACFNHYDDEAVQTEAIDLLATLATFEKGVQYYSTVTSALPSTSAPSTTAAYLSNPFASALTPIMLHQIPFFVYGTTYSNGLRQLAAMHGMAKVLQMNVATVAESDSASTAAAATSALLADFFSFLQKYNSHKSSALDVLLIIAKQPFEDLREAVWKLVLGLTGHRWGLSLIARTGGFLEYLLDRRTEIHVSGMQAKFDILRAIAQSPHANEELAETSLAQVKEFVRQGAHYAPLTVGVMGPVSGARS